MNKSKSRVFVTQENPKLDYSAAEDYGDLVFLTKDDIVPVKNSLHNNSVIQQLKVGIDGLDPVNDFIVITGSPLVSAIVFMLIGRRHRQVNVLKWSNRDGIYQNVSVTI